MKDFLEKYIQTYLKQRKQRQMLIAVLSVFAVVVTTGVFWVLHDNGIAMTNAASCGLEEHQHTEGCYIQALNCPLDEGEEHSHTQECYESTLQCDLQEHTHTLSCISDSTADTETSADWTATLPELSGDFATDLVAVAESQLGYTESTANFTLAEDGTTHLGYTRYGAWYGNEYGEWNSMFAAFCVRYAGGDEELYTNASGAYGWYIHLTGLEQCQGVAAPEVGALVFFDTDEDDKIDTVGIVTDVNDTEITVIQGDYQDTVAECSFAVDDSTVMAFVTLSVLQEQDEDQLLAQLEEEEEITLTLSEEETVEESAEGEESENTDEQAESALLSQQTLTVKSGSTTITVSGQLPEGATITAEPVDAEIDGTQVLLAFDICIYDGDGQIFEPDADTITVTIASDAITEECNVYYIDDEGDAQRLTADSEDGDITFEAEHFSVYAVAASGTVIASGTMDNAEGEADAITWVLTEDDAGNRTLTVSGTGGIPDSTSGSGFSWNGYSGTNTKLVFGEGITRVGNYAFSGWYLTGITFSSTVETLGKQSFSYLRSSSFTSITIPGTVKTVEYEAFVYCYYLVTFNLEEGIETIGQSAFGSQASGATTAYIPASVISIDSGPFWTVDAYVVSEDNEYYCAVDGVLYTKDMKTLVDFPNKKVVDSYTIPESVEVALSGSLSGKQYVRELYILNPNITIKGYGFNVAKYTYIYLADGVSVPTDLSFYNMANLVTVRLPENTAIKLNHGNFHSDIALTSLTLPNGVWYIGDIFAGAYNMESLYYNCTLVTMISSAVFGNGNTLPLLDLTVGPDVDYLVENFYYILEHANTLTMEGPNSIYLEEGAFDNAPAPYTGLSGWIYVDEQGVVYLLDTDAMTATLYGVPETVSGTLTIPATITTDISTWTYTKAGVISAEESRSTETFTVTAIGSNALKYAGDITAVVFEDASTITSLGAYALANSPIMSVTDQKTGTTTTVESEALALFSVTGYRTFYYTELTGAVASSNFEETMDGTKVVKTNSDTEMLTIEVKAGTTTVWTENEDGTGGYTSLTGDGISFVVSAGNTTGQTVTYRVYLQVDGEGCQLDYSTVGQTYVSEGITIQTCATEDPNIIYLEFTIEDSGDTASFAITGVYPSPATSGGGVTIWGAVVNSDGSETTTDSHIDAYWYTVADSYTLEKNNSGQTTISLTADEDGVYLGAELKYEVVLTSDGEYSTIGKDYITTVSYTDVLTLPDGMEWDKDILQAIKEGTVTRRSANSLYVGSTLLVNLTLSSSTGLSLYGLSVSYDEETDQVLIHWKVRNTSGYNLNTTSLVLKIYADAFVFDMSEYDASTTGTISNTVTSTVNYTYSGSVTTEATVDKTIKTSAGTVALSKTKTTGTVTYFGQDVEYTLQVYNTSALTYTDSTAGQNYVMDKLSEIMYIKPENMEIMFRAAVDEGAELTITIAGAKLGEGSTVADTDGTEDAALVNTGNTDLGDESSATLTITYNAASGKFTIEVVPEDSESESYTRTGTSLEDMLQELGYGVTRSAVYTCYWYLPVNSEGYFTLKGGQSYTFTLLSTVKSTFQILDNSDWPSQYPKTSSFTITNTSQLYRVGTNGYIKYGNANSISVNREAIIGKSLSIDGVTQGSAPKVSNGDVLDYTVTFTHYGDGTYDDLPIVDDMFGTQYLLVSCALNESNSSILANLYDAQTNPDGTVTVYTAEDGTQYYKLGVGSYTDVVVGTLGSETLTAATITVAAGADQTYTVDGETYYWSGIHTQIHWYFSHLDGGDYVLNICYSAVVDTTGYADDYTIGNMVWANDREGSRIYAGMWGGGTLIGFDKDIVVDADDENAAEEDADGDGIDDDCYSIVQQGQSVTYRLSLDSFGSGGVFILKGSNLADQLPNTYGVFAWSTANVTVDRVEVVDGYTGTVTGYEDLATKWSIGTEYNGIKGDGIYFLLWDSDVSVQFSGYSMIYVYVTLTYPENTDDTSTWSQYTAAVGGNTIENTLYVYRNPSNVTHVLAEEGSVLLQKGVYSLMSSETGLGTTGGSAWFSLRGSSRYYFSTTSYLYRYVNYSVTLYNGGSSRLYINDLYDVLPEGFTYVGLMSGGIQKSVYTATSTYIYTANESSSGNWLVKNTSTDGITYVTAMVTATLTDEGVKFTIGAGNSDTYSISYDSDRGQYYLESGQAIVFGYVCKIGSMDDMTEDYAVNTIAMSYTDYNRAGVSVNQDADIQTSDLDRYSDTNDGDCEVVSATNVSLSYGFEDDTGNTQWLVSSVTLEKGGIKPGIIKETVSYQVDEDSIEIDYTTSVQYKYLVNWQATLINNGEGTIENYTVTDTMPYPYVFSGTVTCDIYDDDDYCIRSGTLFILPESSDTSSWQVGDEITVMTGTARSTTVTVGGDAVTVTGNGNHFVTYNVSYTLRLDVDEDGNAIMEIGFTDYQYAIPEGGYIVLGYTSYNPTNTAANETYINQVTLTPSQSFVKSSIQAGSAVTDEDGNLVGVSSLSAVTVANGYATSSYKSVTEKDLEDGDTAYSYTGSSYIVLTDDDSVFTYTLNVGNINDLAITKMVLIDNLPQLGDLYTYNTDIARNSEFAVSLASPDFTVSVTYTEETESGEEQTITKVLSSEEYTVEWSSFVPTEDSDFTTEDRKGTSTDRWQTLTDSTDLSAVGSFRIIINAEIPANGSVSISFDAKVSGDAEPGAIAWNNFGYGYSVSGSSTWLEAMPLVVGVMVPSAPEISKKLVSLTGNAITVETDQTFTFVVYQGEEIEESYNTLSQLKSCLTTNDIAFKEITVTVQAGQSESDVTVLKSALVGWEWQDGQTYTVVEFCDSFYTFKQWDESGSKVSTSSSYTFTYDRATTLSAVCVNQDPYWSLSITKVDAEDESILLSGAVFALYSSSETTLYQQYEAQETYTYKNTLSVALTTQINGETWYLETVGTTAEGVLDFGSLTEDLYYLVEVKAPDGYNLDNDPVVVSKTSIAAGAVVSKTITNTAGVALPSAGSMGTGGIYALGAMLIAVAVIALLRKKKTL